MRHIRRFIAGGLLIFTWALAWGGGAVEASPAQAAGIMIDDPSDGIQCPGANTSLTDLSTLGMISGQTITLCSGEYTGPLIISGRSNVKIIGKADKVLGQPRIIPAANASGTLISIQNSTSVSITGLTLDGEPRNATLVRWNSAATQIYGIHVVNSSVSISQNTIIRMRRPTPDSTLVGTGIQVDGSAAATQAITITGNTLFDFQGSGIWIDSAQAHYVPNISKNLVSTDTDPGTGMIGVLVGYTTGGSISGNTITGTFAYRQLASCCIGIQAQETQKLKISGNKIGGMQDGIFLSTSHVHMDSSDNTISGNTVTDALVAIMLQAVQSGGSTGPIQLLRTKVTGNKVTYHSLDMYGTGVSVQKIGTVTLTSNTVTGNTLLGYPAGDEVYSQDTNPADVLFSKNKVGNPLPGQ